MALGQLLAPMFDTVDTAHSRVRRRRGRGDAGSRCWWMPSPSISPRMAGWASPRRCSPACCARRKPRTQPARLRTHHTPAAMIRRTRQNGRTRPMTEGGWPESGGDGSGTLAGAGMMEPAVPGHDDGRDTMTHDTNHAAERLAAVMSRENAALAALDLRRAAGMLAEKQAGRGGIRCRPGARPAPRPQSSRGGCATWRRTTARSWSMRSPCSAGSSA